MIKLTGAPLQLSVANAPKTIVKTFSLTIFLDLNSSFLAMTEFTYIDAIRRMVKNGAT
jgi:hypothetical protein